MKYIPIVVILILGSLISALIKLALNISSDGPLILYSVFEMLMGGAIALCVVKLHQSK